MVIQGLVSASSRLELHLDGIAQDVRGTDNVDEGAACGEEWRNKYSSVDLSCR